MSTIDIRDDFAGPGGWEQGLRLLGHAGPVVGVEHDRAACDTAEAAGFARIQGDVQDPTLPVPTGGYIASPPCQTFSAAGKGDGRKHLDRLLDAVQKVADGASPADAVAAVDDDELDARSVLVLHPLAIIRDHRPRWVALEQVPAVLSVWRAYVDALAGLGYLARTDYLQAEQHGVPQTRKRAVLVAVRRDVASLHGLDEAPWPTPTHSRYYSRDRGRLDDGVLPWVSMAQALGWERDEVVDGHDSRDRQWVYRASNQAHAARRPLDAPAPTVVGGARSNKVEWMPSELADDPRASGVRVTVEEAGVLQSFPRDYPWQGTKTKQHQQVGNAIPPLLAAAVLAPLLPLTTEA